MKNKNSILYVLIGVLMGVILVLGGMFYLYSSKMNEMEIQVKAMKKTMKSTLVQVKKGEAGEPEKKSDDLDAEYVDMGEEDSSSKKKKDKKAKEEEQEEEQVDPATQFDILEPQVDEMISAYQDQVGGQWAVYVEDLDTGGHMSINEGQMQAASLIKLYIMGAVYEHYDELGDKDKLDSLLYDMITVSDNDAANKLVKLLGDGDAQAGREAVDAFCLQYGYGNTTMGRMLLEKNPSGENYTSVEDCGKFLYHVYNGKFRYSEEMWNLLREQTRRSKIPAGIPEGIEVGNKTGELDDVQNDVAIVMGETPYIVCIMSEEVEGEEGPVEAIAQMSGAIYGYINQT